MVSQGSWAWAPGKCLVTVCCRWVHLLLILHLLPLDLLPPEVCSLLNPAAIYANNEISLRDVEVYGFDYDYTLAQYADALHPEIFTAARDILIEHYKVRLAGQGAPALE